MELLALFVSSLGHDLDHRGTNNQYQMSSVSTPKSTPTGHGSLGKKHMICIMYTQRNLTKIDDAKYCGIVLILEG
jgi:cGMP-dependent 3',5'-cyclic phosphodiesterase